MTRYVEDDVNVLLLLQSSTSHEADGEFVWQTDVQAYVLSAFFYGYVLTQIPAGILGKKYGNIHFLGIGMLINSVFGLLVPIAAKMGLEWLLAVRFIQGLGEVRRRRLMAPLQADAGRLIVKTQSDPVKVIGEEKDAALSGEVSNSSRVLFWDEAGFSSRKRRFLNCYYSRAGSDCSVQPRFTCKVDPP